MTMKNPEIIRLSDFANCITGRHNSSQQSIAHRYDLAEVDVALFSEVKDTRPVLRESLQGGGFQPFRTTIVSEIEKLRSVLRKGIVDMLTLEADSRPKDMYCLVREIRDGGLGPNPFIVITIVTWRADKNLIHAFLKAGADDVVVMPASISFTSGRVNNLIDSRREFVVTASYVGPDRRSKKRVKADELDTILVPNGLRYKATGDKDAKPNAARLHRVNRIVQEHRLRRLTIRLEELAGEIERFIVKNPGIPVDGLLLGQLPKMVEKITVFNKKQWAHDGFRAL